MSAPFDIDVASLPRYEAIETVVREVAPDARVEIVGGWLRDRLLRLPVEASPDLDLRVEGITPRELAEGLVVRLGGHVVCPPDFPTASWHAAVGRERIDIAAFRDEDYPVPGGPPRTRRGSSDEDLARRDFSVNAMAYPLWPRGARQLTDPYGGVRDTKSGVLRILHPLSFVDDPTRGLRAARYAIRFGFVLEEGTAVALRARASGRGPGPAEARSGARLRSEWQRILEMPRPDALIRLLCTWEAQSLLGLSRLGGDDPQIERFGSALGGSLDPSVRTPLHALALLAPEEAIEETILWFDLPEVDASLLRELSGATARWKALLIGFVGAENDGGGTESAGTVPPAQWPELDELVSSIPPSSRVQLRLADPTLDALLAFWEHEVQGLPPLIRGDDLLALGWTSGPELGEGLKHVRREQLRGRINSVAEALACATRWREDS